jgi:hypothetical protein
VRKYLNLWGIARIKNTGVKKYGEFGKIRDREE